jgi:hypothetical protein
MVSTSRILVPRNARRSLRPKTLGRWLATSEASVATLH